MIELKNWMRFGDLLKSGHFETNPGFALTAEGE